MHRKEYDLIDGLIAQISQELGVLPLQVSYPDMVPGKDKEIDAVAEGSGIRLAIEHTSVDSFAEQRADDVYFREFATYLEQNLAGQFPGWEIWITVYTGQKYKAVSEIICKWLVESIPLLPKGFSRQEVPGTGVEVAVEKTTSSDPLLYVARFPPQDRSLTTRVADQLEPKARKLLPYREGGYRTILLVESSDAALMNWGLMSGAVEYWIAGSKTVPDEVWWADTSLRTRIEFRRLYRQGENLVPSDILVVPLPAK